MRVLKLILAILLVAQFGAKSYASTRENTCDAYPDFITKVGHYTQNSIYYYMSNNKEAILPPADSVWVLGTESLDVPVMIIHAAEGESIDISSLEKGVYLLCVQLGDCQSCHEFFKRENQQEAIHYIQSILSPFTKLLRDGQLLINIGDKLYNAQGQEVR